MNKKLKIDGFFPLGIDYIQEIKWTFTGFILSFLYSLGYLAKLLNSYNSLFHWYDTKKILINGAVMDDFAVILRGSLSGLIIIAICMIALGIYHYMYHYLGSKSIYLMRRLPKRFDLWKRCFAFPVAAIVILLVIAFILLVFYYLIYLLVTPEQCFAPEQWQKIWIYYLGI